MRSVSSPWDEPATHRQKSAICRLAMANRIREEIELKQMTKRVAREIIYRLRNRLRTSRGRKN